MKLLYGSKWSEDLVAQINLKNQISLLILSLYQCNPSSSLTKTNFPQGEHYKLFGKRYKFQRNAIICFEISFFIPHCERDGCKVHYCYLNQIAIAVVEFSSSELVEGVLELNVLGK